MTNHSSLRAARRLLGKLSWPSLIPKASTEYLKEYLASSIWWRKIVTAQDALGRRTQLLPMSHEQYSGSEDCMRPSNMHGKFQVVGHGFKLGRRLGGGPRPYLGCRSSRATRDSQPSAGSLSMPDGPHGTALNVSSHQEVIYVPDRDTQIPSYALSGGTISWAVIRCLDLLFEVRTGTFFFREQ